MVLHLPRSYKTKAEMEMASPEPISGQASKPIVYIVQDCLNGAYIMTTNESNKTSPRFSHDFSPEERKKCQQDGARTNVITQYQFMDISLSGKNLDGTPLYNKKKLYEISSVFKKMGCKKSLYGGHSLFSLILPNTLNYENTNNASTTEPTVKIYHGVLYEGVLDKNILGGAYNSLIQIFYKEYGRPAVYNFINNIHGIINSYLLIKGLTISLDDCLLDSKDSKNAIKQVISECFTQAKAVEETTMNAGIREIRITASLNRAKDAGLRIAKDAMKPTNNFLIPIKSGSKGDFFNIAQITGLCGQQNLSGQRVKYTLNNGTRSLPHYPRYGMPKHLEHQSHGFISNSFISGLTPEEFYFHAFSGREGIIDTALMTGISGYNQRRMVKFGEDITSQHDGTLRDLSGSVYQMLYWDNGLDPQQTVKVDGQQFFCDVSRLAGMLNAKHENIMMNKFRKAGKQIVVLLRIIKFWKKNK